MPRTRLNKNGITTRQQEFAERYLTHLNGAQAYREVYGPYIKNPAVQASQLLNNPSMRAYLESRRGATITHLSCTRERVLQALLRVAFFDPRELYGKDGEPLPISELSDDAAGAIAGVTEEQMFDGVRKDRREVGRIRAIKASDRVKAIDLAGKHLGLWDGDAGKKDRKHLLKELVSAIDAGYKDAVASEPKEKKKK